MWPSEQCFFFYFIEMTVTLLTFYFESYKGAVRISPLDIFSGLTGQQMELACCSTTHATKSTKMQNCMHTCSYLTSSRDMACQESGMYVL